MIESTHKLKDAGLVAASAAGTVDGSAKIVDLGAGIVEGKLVIDVTAIEIASNDELYTISLQGSSKSDFADTFEDLAIIDLGAKEVLGGDVDSTTGRYEVPFKSSATGRPIATSAPIAASPALWPPGSITAPTWRINRFPQS